MALVLGYGREYVWPGHPGTSSTPGLILDADGESYGCTARIPVAGTLDKIHVPFGLIAQAPANGLKVSLEGRTFTNPIVHPDGNVTHYRVIPQGDIAANTIVATELITDDGTDNGNKKVLAVGDEITITITFDSFSAGDDVDIIYLNTAGYVLLGNTRAGGLPYKYAAWAYSNTLSPNLVLEYNDGTLVPLPPSAMMIGCAATVVAYTITGVSTPDEAGVKFVAPFTGKIGGVWEAEIHANPGGREWKFYDSGDTLLTTQTITTTDTPTTGITARKTWFNTPQVVTKGSTYRITMKSYSGNSCVLYHRTYTAAMAAAMFGGADHMLTERKSSGDWTDTSTRKPHMAVIYSELYDPAVAQTIHPIGAGITA